MSEELKPCPMCGSKNIGEDYIVTYSTYSSYNTFGCLNCGLHYEVSEKGREDTEKWNRRDDSATAELRTELATCKQALQVAERELEEARKALQTIQAITSTSEADLPPIQVVQAVEQQAALLLQTEFQLADARKDSERLEKLEQMANIKIVESNRPNRWMIERDTLDVPRPIHAPTLREAIDKLP